MPLDYPHPAELEQRGGLHYKPFRPLRLTTFFLIQPLTRAILFYLASNPRSRVNMNPILQKTRLFADRRTSFSQRSLGKSVYSFFKIVHRKMPADLTTRKPAPVEARLINSRHQQRQRTCGGR